MEAARTSSGSGTRHRRCRCCLPALTGFTTSRRGEADASHHGRARDGSQHDVKTGEKPAPRRAGTRSYHNELGANSVRRRARSRRAGREHFASGDGVWGASGAGARDASRWPKRNARPVRCRVERRGARDPRRCTSASELRGLDPCDSRSPQPCGPFTNTTRPRRRAFCSAPAIFQSRGRRGKETPTPLNMALACDN